MYCVLCSCVLPLFAGIVSYYVSTHTQLSSSVSPPAQVVAAPRVHKQYWGHCLAGCQRCVRYQIPLGNQDKLLCSRSQD
ncbi:hypothetical protein F5Y10DRAFT_91975 [Nemania abortiva]|nr:hypothetical protein F5Y10DRAFT_91975 [Nemania abortiva]